MGVCLFFWYYISSLPILRLFAIPTPMPGFVWFFFFSFHANSRQRGSANVRMPWPLSLVRREELRLRLGGAWISRGENHLSSSSCCGRKFPSFSFLEGGKNRKINDQTYKYIYIYINLLEISPLGEGKRGASWAEGIPPSRVQRRRAPSSFPS